MQWTTIFKKEMLEYWRNVKWIWVPLVFILLSIMDPITTYYLPQIIESVGGMPEGATFTMPELPPADAFMLSLSQLSMLGVAVVVLMSMGLISGERKSGVTELVLVKPVRYFNYISAKWAATLVLVLSSLIVGLLSSWYYVNLLFGKLTLGELIQTICFYGLWMALVVTINTFFNTLFKTPGLVGGLTIITLMVMGILNQIFNHAWTWFPNQISSYIRQSLHSGEIPSELWGTSIVTIAVIIGLLIASLFTFRNREMAN